MEGLFDSNDSDGLSLLGGIVLILVFGVIAYLVWQVAYSRATDDVLQLGAPGCVVTDANGKRLTEADLKRRKRVAIPKGSSLTSNCINPL